MKTISYIILLAHLLAQLPIGPGARSINSGGGGGGATIQLSSYYQPGQSCNGTSDTSASFRAALADVPNHWTGGAPVTLQLPSGTCAIYGTSAQLDPTSQICQGFSVPSNVIITGTGITSSVIKMTNYPDTACSPSAPWAIFSVTFNIYDHGGYHNAATFYLTGQATAGTNTITMNNISQASNFTAGHYVILYERNPSINNQPGPNGGTLILCDICPNQLNQIAPGGVNVATGVITMVHPWNRTFATYSYTSGGTPYTTNPALADVDNQTIRNSGLKNLTVEGSAPININKVSDLTFTNVNLQVDNNVGSVSYPISGRTYTFYLNSNAVNYTTFTNTNIIVNPLNGAANSIGGEWFQDNSSNWTWQQSNIGIGFNGANTGLSGLGFDEFAKGVNVNHNTFYAACTANNTVWGLGGFNGIVDNNTFITVSGDCSGTNVSLIQDGIEASCAEGCNLGGGMAYMLYEAGAVFSNNTITCTSTGGSCLFLVAPGDTIGPNNSITATAGNDLIVYQFGHSNDFNIHNNTFAAPGLPISLQIGVAGSSTNNGWAFSNNHNNGPGTGVAINQPAGGTCTVTGNTAFSAYSSNTCSGAGTNN